MNHPEQLPGRIVTAIWNAAVDDDGTARAIFLSGSYMLYADHGTEPPPEAIADDCAVVAEIIRKVLATIGQRQVTTLDHPVRRTIQERA
ncbi:MAG: hypothetical protein OXS29_07525 [bacterium]|nr:hypothetical protein [bacterium]MDE0287538.1 hypothetical protein [bacterium]MDE0440357.1 hypothetical protein [bacterium]